MNKITEAFSNGYHDFRHRNKYNPPKESKELAKSYNEGWEEAKKYENKIGHL